MFTRTEDGFLLSKGRSGDIVTDVVARRNRLVGVSSRYSGARARGSRCTGDVEQRLARKRWDSMDTAMAPKSTGIAQAIRIDPAWPWDWENRPAKDVCDHVWEVVIIARLFDPDERVARCVSC